MNSVSEPSTGMCVTASKTGNLQETVAGITQDTKNVLYTAKDSFVVKVRLPSFPRVIGKGKLYVSGG